MKGYRVVFPDVKNAILEPFEVPPLPVGSVLIETEYSVVSAGTERANLLSMPNTSGRFPFYPGYSAVGRVVDRGIDTEGLVCGDRVIVYHGGHQSHSVMHAEGLVKVDREGIDSLDAAFTVIASMSLQGLRKVRLELGESVLIVGQGLLGIFATQLASLSGGMPVVALDLDRGRRELTLALGADYAFTPEEPDLVAKILAITRGRGVDAVIEVSGSSRALAQALELTAGQGRVALLGCTRVSDASIDFYRQVHKPGITIIGAHNFVRPQVDSYAGYWTREDDYRVLIDLMAKGRFRVAPIVSKILSPSRAGDFYSTLAKDPLTPIGIVFDWHDAADANQSA